LDLACASLSGASLCPDGANRIKPVPGPLTRPSRRRPHEHHRCNAHRTFTDAERKRLQASLGQRKAMLLRNHGLLVANSFERPGRKSQQQGWGALIRLLDRVDPSYRQ